MKYIGLGPLQQIAIVGLIISEFTSIIGLDRISTYCFNSLILFVLS